MTLILRLTLTALCIACWLAPASQAEPPTAPPRIAVIAASEDKDAASLADLLTAAMSQASHGYELLERAELNRIAQEAEVQAVSAAERPRALARLARADGLILLSVEPSENGRKSISARLSSTGSGLILQTFILAAEAKELPTAANLAADALRFAAARIGKAGDAVPHIVSLLGIRASTSSSPGVAMEVTLNTAITHHLSNTSGFGVVERWKLDDVAFERSLSEKDMPAIATGTVLVDGSLEIKDKTAITKVRIRKSQADTGIIFPVESPADDIPALAKAIAMKVTAESGTVISPKSWDSKAEAAAYAKLGHWLLAQKMARDAAQAYETAVALGDSDPETLFKRIYAYCSIADPDNPKTQNIGGQIEYSAFSRRIQQLVEAPKFFPNFLRNANRALAYAEELLSKEWHPAPGTINANDYSFASRAAMMGCHLLVAGHRLQMHLKYPGELAALRERTEFFARFHLRQLRRTFTNFNLAFYAGYWAATPDEAVNLWLEFLKPKQNVKIVGYIHGWFLRQNINNEFSVSGSLHPFTRIPSWPLIVDWSGADNARGDAAWQRLLKTLKDSPSLASKGDGFTLEIYTQKDPKECEKVLASYLDMLEQNRALLANPTEQGALLFYDPTVRSLTRQPDAAKRFASVFERLFEGASKIDPDVFRSILTQVEAYLGLTNERTLVLPRDEARRLHSAIQHYIGSRTAAGEKVDRTTVAYSELLNIAAALQHAYPDDGVLPAPKKIPQNLADSIRLQFLPIAKKDAPRDRRYWVHDRGLAVCGDNLLVERQPEMGQASGANFVEVGRDLSMREIPPVPKKLFNEYLDSIVSGGSRFFLLAGDLYATSWKGSLVRYSHNSRAWNDASALLGGQRFQPVGVVNDTLYAATFDEGFTLGKLNSGNFELLASSRRRPAENPLDELGGAAVNAVFPGGQGRPCAIMRLPNHFEIHDLELKKRLFSLGNARRLTMSGKTLVIEDLYIVAAIDPDSGVPRALIRRPYPKMYNTNILKDDLPPETVWDWPKDIPVDFYQGVNFVSTSFAVHGDHLFVLKCQHSLDALTRNKNMEPSLDKLSLLCYEPGRRDAIEIPLTFNAEVLAHYGLGDNASHSALQNPEFNALDVHTTSAGLFFEFSDRWPGGRGVAGPKPGILHLPWSDVNDWLFRHGHAPIAPFGSPVSPVPKP